MDFDRCTEINVWDKTNKNTTLVLFFLCEQEMEFPWKDDWDLICDFSEESILFPRLINLYIKPSAQIIQSFRVSCHQYIGDNQLYISLPKSLGAAVKVLNPSQVQESEGKQSEA